MNPRAHSTLLFPALICFLFSSTPSNRQTIETPPASAANYKLTWSDDFSAADGTRPDQSKWTYEQGVSGNGWGNNELQSYTDLRANSEILGGNLVITAKKEKFVGADGIEREYTSARLKTQRKFSQAYGRFEARIKIPKGEGMWPAFWLLGENINKVDWPQSGEIDIMENIGKEPGTVYGSLHGPSSSPKGNKKIGTSDLSKPFRLPEGQKFADDFHLYAVEWEPATIRFYVDTNLYATFNKTDWPAGEPWVFDHPFFILLNLAVGGDWPGAPDKTTKFPQKMLIDYVRVYSK